MPSKYWEDSADLSRDSSAESEYDLDENSTNVEASPNTNPEPTTTTTPKQTRPNISRSQTESIEEVDRVSPDLRDGTVSRVMGTNFQLPALEPHEYANLFYLSLIEGRCRTQATASINAGRSKDEKVATEDDPEVSVLANHLFTEMSKELVKAGMIPKEYIGRPLTEIRQYLKSFDSVLHGIATRPLDISEHRAQRAIDFDFRKPALGKTIAEASSSHRPMILRKYERSNDLSSIDPFDRSEVPHRQSNFRVPSINEPSVGGTYSGDLTFSDCSESNSFFGNVPSQALIRQNDDRFGIAQLSSLRGNFLPTQSQASTRSKFAIEYTKTATLGKGGFGVVVKAISRVDRAEYAIKRIKTPAAKMQQLAENGRIEELLKEVHALARYNHPHIVRYFHAWVETRPARVESEGAWSDKDEDSADTNRTIPKQDNSQVETIAEEIGSLALQNQQALDEAFRQRPPNSTAHEIASDQVVFELDHSSHSNTKRSFFRSALEPESDSDEDRASAATTSDAGSTSTISLSRHQSDGGALALQNVNSVTPPALDCLIYIKMTSYPLTLSDFIFPAMMTEPTRRLSTSHLRHCFHPLPTIRLLLRLASGLAYLHRKDQIHRDLKPANIFLSLLEDGEQPTEAWVDINDCPDCVSEGVKRKSCYVSPCIGDFGLVVDLKDLNCASTSSNDALAPDQSNDSPTDKLPQIPGTKLYIPPTQSNHNIICPKLDMYALGVITFELLQKFDTKSERFCVLSEAREGKWPKGWEEDNGGGDDKVEFKGEQHPIAKGVKGMMAPEIEQRWSCEGVRMWAVDVERKLFDKGSAVKVDEVE